MLDGEGGVGDRGHRLDSREEGLHRGRGAEQVGLRVGIGGPAEYEGLGRGGRGEKRLEERLLLLFFLLGDGGLVLDGLLSAGLI